MAFLLAALAGCSFQSFLRVRRVTLDPRLEVFLGGGGNSVALLHGAEALLVDTKFSGMARQLRYDLEVELARKVERIVLTHSHVDHVSGLPLYPSAGAVLVHPATRRRLEAQGLRGEFVEVEREVQLRLGGEQLRVLSPGRGHTDGDLAVLFVERRLLVTGDLVTLKAEPNIDLASGGAPLEWASTLDALLALDFDRVVPGHGEVTDRTGVVRMRDYLRALEQTARACRAQGLGEDACVAAARIDGFDDLEPLPSGIDRARNVRLMYRALVGEKPEDGGVTTR